MDAYELSKTIHVLAAVIWVGGATASQLYAMRTRASGDPARLASFARDAEWIGMRVFLPMSLFLVATGFWMIGEGNLDWEAWIIIGLVAWAASALTGATFLGPESGRVAAAIEREGPESPEAQRRISRIFLVSRIELVILLIIVVDMVVKPGA
jgi:uncharacterized membrane protein